MGLIDHRILMSGGNPLADGIQQGQGIRQNWQQGQDQGRTRAAAQAFQQAAQGKDITTAEGMGQAIQGMVQAGFADEGRRVFEAHKDLFQKEKPQGQDWSNIPGTNTLYERGTGTFKDTGASRMPKAEIAPPPPVTPGQPPAAPTWKGEKFMRTEGNTMVKVDANGYAQDGSKPKAWIPPAKPGAGPKPPAPPKPMGGDSAKLLSIAWTMQDDIGDIKTAFSQDFEGAIAGIKSGTNKRLVDLADQLSDKLGRLRSGGAVNADEEKRFMRLIATLRGAAFSNAQDAEKTLNGMLREASIIMEAIDPGGSNRARISEALPKDARRTVPQEKSKVDPKSITKPDEEEEYQKWKAGQR